MQDYAIKAKVHQKLIDLLYRQIKPGLIAEILAAIGLTAALWDDLPSYYLVPWMFSVVVGADITRFILVAYYEKTYLPHQLPTKTFFWYLAFGFFTLVSGICWGAAGSLFLNLNDIVVSTFIIFLLVGVTACAQAFYSPMQSIYASFLITSFLPLSIVLLMQSEELTILGCLGLVYILALLAVSYYSHKLITNSLILGFKNDLLVESLKETKRHLENRNEELKKTYSLVKATFESTADAIMIVDSNHTILAMNKQFLKLWNIDTEEIQYKDIKLFLKKILSESDNAYQFIEQMSVPENYYDQIKFDELFLTNGKIYECILFPQKIENKIVAHVYNFRDISRRKSLEEELYHKANFDDLTGLPKRLYTIDHINKSMKLNQDSKTMMAVLFIDLDNFKSFNDFWGHEEGDHLLVEISKRLAHYLDFYDLVSRESGDEFVVVLNTIKHKEDVIGFIENILKIIQRPYFIGNEKINMTASVGVSFYPNDSAKAEELIRNADMAMYHVKEFGGNHFKFYTKSLNETVLEKLVLQREIETAIERHAFYLVYQPLFNIRNQKPVGFEALLRWHHHSLNSLLTNDFVTIAEESGLIHQLGEAIFKMACRDIKKWKEQGYSNFKVNINFSAKQFNYENFYETIYNIIRYNNINPQYLAFELTESVILENFDQSILLLEKLQALGIQLVIDDFGTGYSSLNYLKRLPIQKIKIDRSFIKGLPLHHNNAAITTAIISLAKKLKLQVVAEGVEEKEQLDFLKQLGCDEVQGFYFSKPIKKEDCIKLLDETQNSIKT